MYFTTIKKITKKIILQYLFKLSIEPIFKKKTEASYLTEMYYLYHMST